MITMLLFYSIAFLLSWLMYKAIAEAYQIMISSYVNPNFSSWWPTLHSSYKTNAEEEYTYFFLLY